jgi:DNA-binding winged helix-turn-helix (wHTH) protein/TolB-like protein
VSSTLRFDRFEFRPESGELIADGAIVRLEPQPAKVLALLARRADEVVSREDLQKEVWPADTFVDFERGLNYCVGRIRSALGDSAAAPRFIETLPKRGYRFMPAVTIGEAKVAPAPERAPGPSRSAGPARPASAWIVALAVGAVLLAVALTIALRSRSAVPTIAVTLFDNQAGRAELDAAAQVLTDAVVERLARDQAAWSVIGNARILRTPRPLRDLEAIRSALHTDYFLLGQIQPAENGVKVLTHLIRASDQKHLWVGNFSSPGAVDPRLAERVAQGVEAAAAQHIAGRR